MAGFIVASSLLFAWFFGSRQKLHVGRNDNYLFLPLFISTLLERLSPSASLR
jgi:hypothetical protein